MTKRSLLPTLMLLALAMAAPALGADEDPPVADSSTASKALTSFKRSFDTTDIMFKLDAVKALAAVNHSSVATQLLKLMKDDDVNVRAAAAESLGQQHASVKKVGAKLAKFATDSGEDPKVVRASVLAIGLLKYDRALEDLEKVLRRDEDDVVCGVMWAFGEINDHDALEPMLKWYEEWPDEKGFSAISVSVDTGTAGSGDQKAAEAKGKSMQAKANSWRKRPTCTEALRQAGKKMTGFVFLRPEDLRSYLDNPKKYVDPELIAERRDEPQRRALWDAYQNIYKESMAAALEEVPDEDEGQRRSHVHFRHMEKLRKELIEKESITLSELDVILREGKEKRWPL